MIDAIVAEQKLEIRQHLVHEGVHIYLLDVPQEEMPLRGTRDNIYGADENGQVIWRIEDSDGFFDYSKIFVENGELHAYSGTGMERVVNPRTGEVIRQQQVI